MIRQSFFVRGFLPILFCALMWGSAFPAIKTIYALWQEQGVQLGLPLMFLFAGLRFTLAGSGLLVLAKNPLQEFRQTPKKILFIFALSQTFIQYIFFYVGMSVSSASLSALLVSTGSFWWVLLAPLMLKTAYPSKGQWFALILGCIGVSIAVFSPNVGEGNPVLGALLLSAATFFGAIAVLLFRTVRKTMGGKAATGFSQLMGGLGLLLLGLQAWPDYSLFLDKRIVLTIIYLSFVSAAGFSIWNHLSTVYPVPLMATFRFLIPVCGVFESLLFLDSEDPGYRFFIGASLVVAAMILASWYQRISEDK